MRQILKLLKIHFGLLLILFFHVLRLGAQSLPKHQSSCEFGFLCGLNSDGYEVSANAAWFPIPYAGVKAEAGFAGEIKKFSDWGTEYTAHHYCIRFKFIPSVEFRTPTLVHWSSRRCGIRLFVNPGISFSPGGSGSHHAEWCNWTVRTGLLFQGSNARISIGYGLTDYHLLSGHAYSGRLDDDATHRPFTHLVFISAAIPL